MPRFLFLAFLFVSASLGWPALGAPADELPARPSPFRFVTDEAKLLTSANAQTLEGGLRRYADNTGTQIVVVTVPSLGGREVADYGRALGEAWGVGQKDKDNGIVVLLSGQERKVTIQAGSGLRSAITPELTSRIINQEMTPSFKQGNYFAGLRAGLNSLMLAANPDSNPNKNQPAATAPASADATGSAGLGATAGAAGTDLGGNQATPPPAYDPVASTPVDTEPSGPGMGTLLIGALGVGGLIWLLMRMFRRRSAPAAPVMGAGPAPGPAPGGTPNFYPNQPNQPNQPNFYPNQANQPGPNNGRGQAPNFYPNQGGGMGGGMGSGVGGMLMTGAAAAAGAYIGNRMANGNDSHDGSQLGAGNPLPQPGHDAGAGAALGGAAGGAAGGGFPALGGTESAESAPDYFSEEAGTNSSPDYFSTDDNSSYDDLSSGDTGGGGFDDTSDNSGSW
ncbi:TPM domain-containing protein [Hymenobacter sp. BT175]|uniref:TPM domain-containing protein n=1 Tax=Hymenobacter translucens TaxID=2886507 RepID=UPI001D0E88A0|nr:TPM domain-containing protein [Hymenobacter translucens]MCC2545609.1 TPM domain-containing protein [Hymenobacter translucens]